MEGSLTGPALAAEVKLTSGAKAHSYSSSFTARLKACSTLRNRWADKAAVYLLLAAAVLTLAGCRMDMQVQPYYRPLSESDFYADKRSERPLITGTVARDHLNADTYFYTGKIGANDGDYLPFPATAEVLARGQQRFNIYCTPCHGEAGDGNGMIVQRGYKRPPSYHIDRLRRAPLGYFFDVMTNGFGAMPDYSAQVPAKDRWAIAAYIRALQLSQNATPSDVPSGQQIADAPPPGVTIMPPYDTQGATTAASTPPKPSAVPAEGGARKP